MTVGEDMNDLTLQAVGGGLILILTPILSYVGNRFSAEKQHQAEQLKAEAAVRQEEVKASGPEWREFTSEIKTWALEQLAERDRRIDALMSEIGELKERLEARNRKYWVSIEWNRAWVRAFPDHPMARNPPAEIMNDL